MKTDPLTPDAEDARCRSLERSSGLAGPGAGALPGSSAWPGVGPGVGSGVGLGAEAPVAVIDIGSNSVRLVVFESGTCQPTALYNEKVQCGLARDLPASGLLHPGGVEKALASLERFVALSQAMGVGQLDLLATAAVRDAADGADFVASVRERFGLSVRVLSGEEEARLSTLGVTWGAPRAKGVIGDLGGGSLELVAMKQGEMHQQATLPLGTLRLMAAVGNDLSAARNLIDEEIARLDWLDLDGRASFYAVGGTWRALARVQMALSDYPLRVIHGYRQPRRVIKSVSGLVARQTGRSMAGLASLGAARRETLPLASLVMCRILAAVRPKHVVFSGFGLREGWLFEQQSDMLLGKDPLIGMAENCARRSGRFGDRGKALFAWIGPLFPKKGRKRRRLRRAVCHFVDIAWREHPEYRATYALERILQWPGLAANHRERAFIAHSLFVRYGGTGTSPVVQTLLSREDQYEAQLLGLALRLAMTLAVGDVEPLSHAKLVLEKGRLELNQTAAGSLASGELVERRLGQLQKLIGEIGDDASLRFLP
jgi:exopolyphosphatase/guanosine-5'-triphosphate,3'-diphosphate pyrophosphatase